LVSAVVTSSVTGSTYKTLIDKDTTPNVVYIGQAEPGSDEGDPVWKLTKIDKTGTPTSITYADSGAFTAIWDDRLTEVYT
jgi:hypothetical protein